MPRPKYKELLAQSEYKNNKLRLEYQKILEKKQGVIDALVAKCRTHNIDTRISLDHRGRFINMATCTSGAIFYDDASHFTSIHLI